MPLRPLTLFALLFGLAGFFLFAWYEALYLERGYAFALNPEKQLGPLYAFPIAFPLWRRLAHAAVALGLGLSTLLYVFRSRSALACAWICLLAMAAIGGWDVWAYGRLAAPTSIWSILLALLLTLLINARPPPRLKRKRFKPWEV